MHDTHRWEPHILRTPQLRVHETSCCGQYELASEGGQYLVLRWTGVGERQEERFSWGPPKDGSMRDITVPMWLWSMVAAEGRRCTCVRGKDDPAHYCGGMTVLLLGKPIGRCRITAARGRNRTVDKS